MKRTQRIPGQREALIEQLQTPRPRTPDELREYVCRELDAGRSEIEIAVALGWDLADVRRAAAERVLR